MHIWEGWGRLLLCESEQRFVTRVFLIPTHVAAVRVTMGSLRKESWVLGDTSPDAGTREGLMARSWTLRLCWT